MAEANGMTQAKTVYEDLCAALDRRGWHYQRHDEDLVITFKSVGEDLPMDFIFVVDSDRQLLRVFSGLPFVIPEEKRMDLAIATCIASDGLADGSFDFDIKTGRIVFRLTASFMGSRIGDGLFDYLINCSGTVVDMFNDKFLLLSKGAISINDFIARK